MGSGGRRRKREALKGFPMRAFSSYWCGGWDAQQQLEQKGKAVSFFLVKFKIGGYCFFLFLSLDLSIQPRSTTVPASPIWLDEDVHTAQRFAACAFAASVYPPSNAFAIATNLPGILNQPLPERSRWRVFHARASSQRSWQRSTRSARGHNR